MAGKSGEKINSFFLIAVLQGINIYARVCINSEKTGKSAFVFFTVLILKMTANKN